MADGFLDRILARLARPILRRLDAVSSRVEKTSRQLAQQSEQMKELRQTVRGLGTRLRDLERRSDAQIRQVEAVRQMAPEVGRAMRRFDDLRTAIASTSRSLEEIARATGQRGVTGRVEVVARDVRALLRRATLNLASLPYPERLLAARANLTSQNEGDGILLAILDEVKTGTRQFVDIGSGISGGATAVLARELGWGGLMVDGNPEHVRLASLRFNPRRVTVVHGFVTAENVNALMAGSIDLSEVGVMAIDIDGMDFWVLEAITARPPVVVTEFNAHFGFERAVTVPYDPDFRRSAFPGALRKQYLGASLPAFMGLMRDRGYRLVAVDQPGLNAFFVRDDVAPQIPACTLEALPYLKSGTHKFPDVFDAIRAAGLPLIDLSEPGPR